MPKYKVGDMVIFLHKTTSRNYLTGMVQTVAPSGSNDYPNHYNILCESMQCEILVAENDIIDLAY